MSKFVKAVADVLEVEPASLSLDTRFRELDGWCSLKAFGLLVMLENDWFAPTQIGRFVELETIRDLCREVFASFAAGVLKVPREMLLAGSVAYGSIPEWDSVNHLRLVMEAEPRFGISYPLEKIPFLKTVDDFLCGFVV
jgi:acyl carrier protein